MCDLISSTTFDWNISHYKKSPARYHHKCTVPVILVIFCRNSNFLDRFSRNSQLLSFVKIHPVEAELFHAAQEHTDIQPDGHTDMTMLVVAYRNFANLPN